MFQLGATYTRRQIHDALGGSLQGYLPYAGGRVVAACLRLDTNPDAPGVILPGRGEWVERSADLLVSGGAAVPTFIKRGSERWEYVGDYAPVRSSRAPAELAAQARRSGRRDITRAIEMAAVSPPTDADRLTGRRRR